MHVTVEYFGPAREAAGMARETIECTLPTTARELITRWARERGGRLASLLLVDDKLSRSVILAVNDEQVAKEVDLEDGDVVSVIPPVSGGARFDSHLLREGARAEVQRGHCNQDRSPHAAVRDSRGAS
jgi:molybdopterin converting factor small subunit